MKSHNFLTIRKQKTFKNDRDQALDSGIIIYNLTNGEKVWLMESKVLMNSLFRAKHEGVVNEHAPPKPPQVSRP